MVDRPPSPQPQSYGLAQASPDAVFFIAPPIAHGRLPSLHHSPTVAIRRSARHSTCRSLATDHASTFFVVGREAHQHHRAVLLATHRPEKCCSSSSPPSPPPMLTSNAARRCLLAVPPHRPTPPWMSIEPPAISQPTIISTPLHGSRPSIATIPAACHPRRPCHHPTACRHHHEEPRPSSSPSTRCCLNLPWPSPDLSSLPLLPSSMTMPWSAISCATMAVARNLHAITITSLLSKHHQILHYCRPKLQRFAGAAPILQAIIILLSGLSSPRSLPLPYRPSSPWPTTSFPP